MRFLSRWAACGVAPATLRLKMVYAALSSDYDSFSFSHPIFHACVPDSPLVDGRPRTPSPGCLGSSSRLCPSSCRSCGGKGNEPLIRTETSTQTQQISLVQFLPPRPVWSPHRATGEPAAHVSYRIALHFLPEVFRQANSTPSYTTHFKKTLASSDLLNSFAIHCTFK